MQHNVSMKLQSPKKAMQIKLTNQKCFKTNTKKYNKKEAKRKKKKSRQIAAA